MNNLRRVINKVTDTGYIRKNPSEKENSSVELLENKIKSIDVPIIKEINIGTIYSFTYFLDNIDFIFDFILPFYQTLGKGAKPPFPKTHHLQ